MNPDPTYSWEAKNQLARLYNAVLTGGVSKADYFVILAWIDDSLIALLRESGFDNIGVPARRLFGFRTDPTLRVVSASHLPRVVRAFVSRSEIDGAIRIEDLVFVPDFGE